MSWLSFAGALLAGGRLFATELALPAPDVLVVHRDGAAVGCTLHLVAGEHVVAIPWRDSGRVAVRGAAWSLGWEPLPADAPPPPAEFAALVAERNRVVAAGVALAARRAALERIGNDLRVRLALAATGSGHDLAAWQASVDAWATTSTALDVAAAADRAARLALAARAEALARDAGDWLALSGEPIPLGSDDAARALAMAARPAGSRRVLHLSLATDAVVTVEIALPSVRWQPAAVLAVHGGEARLTRLATLVKPADLDLGTLPVTVTTTPLAPTLAGAKEPRVRLGSEAIVASQRRLVQSTTRGVELRAPPTSAPPPSPDPAARTADGSKVDSKLADVVTENVADSAPVDDQPALRWELGPLALPRDQERITAERPAVSLDLTGDEWAVIPAQSPVARRRLGVRLDPQPLLAGPLTLVVDDAIIGVEAVAAQTPGASLTLCAGEDAAVFAAPAVPWTVAANEKTDRRQRQGSTFTLHNFADAARTVAVYQTFPVSHSAELTVTLAGTSEGATTVEPGVVRWTFTLAPGGSQEIALGWILAAGGGLKL